MFRPFCSALAIAACLITTPAHAELIDDLAALKGALDSLCGSRFDVIMLDESEQLPPCMMSYSQHCEEMQYQGPASCEVVMRLAPSDDDAMMSVSTY
ncbi:hypothetical protein SAMN02745857_01707 [Andreprevotia lacus DSM 23236]|jgi:hypothetical protein|uniref:Uncharacterized protein n=1 Tax=Andreprevotia lacus DSM 23236 TaxID=1121001 RepID=A0A1W1XJ40_9NEIS|nr:hypothetical protein [Andreprevotia lacus]SMC23842.1 hypothetical protein SAMN02745857_01707 [Andreprevotia lacus DSM 23236]